MVEELSIINKFRPIDFSEVVGNSATVAALRASLTLPTRHHSYLLSGPAGVGKTSIARIIATTLNCAVEEMDAGSNSGVDDTKRIVALSGFQPLHAASVMLIIDECHALSKNAWQPLLKLLEEPPSYMYICLATTDLSKVPDAIKTRCHQVPLRACSSAEISQYLTDICFVQGWDVEPSVFNGIVQASTGQPRKALSLLQVGHAATNLTELGKVVADVESDDSPVIQLVYYLLGGGSDWKTVREHLNSIIDGDEAYGIATKCLTGTMLRSEQAKAMKANALLQALFFPRSGFDRKAQFIAAVTAFLWN